MLKQLFNYYVVLKSCWTILLFQLVGYVALVVFEQGNDILRSLSFSAPYPLNWHTWFTSLAVVWWSWQSWRAARVELHFTTFDFVKFSKRYALQAQVLIPRLLGITPIFIFVFGLVKATSWSNPIIYIFLCVAVWLFVFYIIRKDIIVYFMSRSRFKFLNIPDYILIKNQAYPASFIWAKQGPWIMFRLLCISVLFVLVVIYPVHFPQAIGSSGIILFALGSWLVISTFLIIAEKHFRFPFVFTTIVLVVVFSFFNNNHGIRTLETKAPTRPTIEAHFKDWYSKQTPCENDSVPVILVAAQGGGIRASYWAAQVLAEMQEHDSRFFNYTYAYSGVSGGSLGVATYQTLVENGIVNLKQHVHDILSKDFLSPVSSWLVIPDLVQKFLPIPIDRVDRAKALEYSWEEAATIGKTSLLGAGFLETTIGKSSLYFYNATKAENGFTTMITNVQTNKQIFPFKEDLFDVIDKDIPYSTAISLSSRFPFLTPPGLVHDQDGKTWGHLVDGGYVENMGASTLLELYDYLKVVAEKNQMKTKFYLVFIRNTRDEYKTEINGLHELMGPLNTFAKVWVNSGNITKRSTSLRNLDNRDETVFIALDRPEDQLIPLGWYLSPTAVASIDTQLSVQTAEFKKILNSCLGQQN